MFLRMKPEEGPLDWLYLATSAAANSLASPKLPLRLGQREGGESPLAGKLFMLEIRGQAGLTSWVYNLHEAPHLEGLFCHHHEILNI